jgi:hypothetical protein
MEVAAMILARTGLLDALETIGEHRTSVVLVGAQAVYLHTSAFSSPVAEFTIDADLAFLPELLADSPLIQDCLINKGFRPGPPEMPGRWISPKRIPVDFMIPEKLAGNSRRSAGVAPHAKNTARNTRGIEGCLVDKQTQTVESLDSSDSRSFEIFIAGPSGLLIAKIIKIYERLENKRDLKNKDAYDVYRLLAAVPTDVFVEGVETLVRNALSEEVTREAIGALSTLFGVGEKAPGALLAGEAEQGIGSPEIVAQSVSALAQDLLEKLPKLN